jgi:hypothetical protein
VAESARHTGASYFFNTYAYPELTLDTYPPVQESGSGALRNGRRIGEWPAYGGALITGRVRSVSLSLPSRHSGGEVCREGWCLTPGEGVGMCT